MEIRDKLSQKTKDELTALARLLGLINFSALNKAELVEYILAQVPPKKLETELNPGKKKGLAFYGSIAGIIALALILFFFFHRLNMLKIQSITI